jgi:hypothetical protein
LSISFAETVLIELANAFFKVTIPRYWLSEFLGDQACSMSDPAGIVNGASMIESQGDV